MDRRRRQVSDTASDIASDIASDLVTMENKIVSFCRTEKTSKEIQDFTGYKSKVYLIRRFLAPLVKKGLLKLKFPNNPTHPRQKYIAVPNSNDK
ncbi:MAG: hypothetical protein IJ876_06285 [Elusimicrobiaceae bacterium]|nr:hypothetical protein [Elusimicrobiaceae bacterium]